MLTRILALICALLSVVQVQAHQDPEIAGYIDVPGGQIWYRLNGREFLGKRTPLIAIDGGPGGTHRDLMTLVSLANERPVILYDQLDTGNSTRFGKQQYWTLEHYVAEIDAIRVALKLDQVVVLGDSWGGAIASSYAIETPKGLKGVILSSPLISTPRWIADSRRWIAEMREPTRSTLLKHIEQSDFDSPDFITAQDAYYAEHLCRQSPCPVAENRAGGPKFNEDLYNYMWGPYEFVATGTLRDFDVSDKLKQIKAPTLFVCGEFDEARPDTCQEFASRIPGAQVNIMPGVAHAKAVEDKEGYARRVRAFLNSIDGN